MRCAGNMHSSYYKWNMAIICNPPIMLCATFVPCFVNVLYMLCVDFVTGKNDLDSYLENFQVNLEKVPVTSTLYLVRSGCPNYQGMPVSHPPYVITCF